MSDPKGGISLGGTTQGRTDGLSLFHGALAEGICIAPGCLFSLGGGLDRFIRLNCGVTRDLQMAMAKLGRLAARGAAKPIGA
jgi:DNA-binding transcriptional MocR family regulator